MNPYLRGTMALGAVPDSPRRSSSGAGYYQFAPTDGYFTTTLGDGELDATGGYTQKSPIEGVLSMVEMLGEDVVPTVGKTYTDYTTVLAVQKALKDKGFNPGTLDGVMGPNTARAIRSMQASVGVAQTGVIDASVLSTLNVSASLSGGQRSASAQAALDAATMAEHAATPSDLVAATAQAQAAAQAASPPPPPDVMAKLANAKAAALSASTPAQVAAAKEQVKDATQAVQMAVSGFWGQSLIGPIKRWQAAVGVGAAVLVTAGAAMLDRRRRRRR